MKHYRCQSQGGNALIVVLVIILVGFLLWPDGLPDEVVKKAEEVPQNIESTLEVIKKKENAFVALQKSSGWEFFKPYAVREQWALKFVAARKEAGTAAKLNKKQILPILDRDKPEDHSFLLTHIFRVNKALRSAKQLVAEPGQRQAFLNKAKAEAPKWVDKAEAEVRDIDQLMAATLKFVNQAKQKDYAHRTNAIQSRFAPLQKLSNDAHGALKSAQAQLAVAEAGTADYAVLGDGTTLVTANLAALRKQKPKLKSTLGELYRSYSKTLIDMRI